MFSIPISRLLVAGVILGLLGFGVYPSFISNNTIADIQIESTEQTPVIHQPFFIDITITATEPVNVFKGILNFDPSILTITSIDYNTSVADLWAEEPWYSNGDGTLSFIGGTTRPGGFTGADRLLRVTFTPQAYGEATLTMNDVRILRHDGLGSDAKVETPIDAIFTIAPEITLTKTIAEKQTEPGPFIYILSTEANTDLNNDGKHTIADTSIFMIHLTTQNLRSDFNQDGSVDLKDLSILNQ